MDLSELKLGAAAPKRTLDIGMDDSFRELLGQLGRECAAPLSSALERLNVFATTGRIERAELRALRAELALARRNGVIGQQISRYASGRVRQNHQRVDLTALLRDTLAQRERESAARGLEVRQNLHPVEVIIDAPMLSALLQALLDWSFEHADGPIELRLQRPPPHALLTCRFARAAAAATALDTLPWRLLNNLARTLGLAINRNDDAGGTQATLEFARTVGDSGSTWQTLDLEDTPASGPNSQPIAGSHLLVLTARRETRNAVRESVRPMGLMVDYVGTVDEARQFCAHGLPHAIVYESALAGAMFQKLRTEWIAEVPALAFIEICEDARTLEVVDSAGRRTSRIGRELVASALPGALLYEMAKSG